MICKVCEARDSRPLYPLKEDPRFTIRRCSRCAVQFLDPPPTEAEIRRIYSRDYYKAWGIDASGEQRVLQAMKKATFRSYMDLVRPYKQSGKALDVGCATGFFPEVALERGFEPYGVEFSEYAAAVAQGKFGKDRIFQGHLEDAGFPAGSFDVISMLDLIEHVPDPKRVLTACRRLLREDGLLLISTPDTGSLSCRMMRSAWVHYKLEHLYYFNVRSIELLGRSCGFRITAKTVARKAINWNYVQTQFNVYNKTLVTPLVNAVGRMLPPGLAGRNFRVHFGEMVLIMKAEST